MEKSGTEANQPRKESPSVIASSELKQSVSQATERIQEVIATAEQVAVQITAEAEEQAGQQLAQAKAEAAQAKAEAERVARRLQSLDAVVAGLSQSAESFKKEADQMLAALSRTIESARAEIETPGTGAPKDNAEAREAPANDASSTPGSNAGDDAKAEAVVRATQMAVKGKDRAAIERTLRSDFKSVDPKPILDEILGRR